MKRAASIILTAGILMILAGCQTVKPIETTVPETAAVETTAAPTAVPTVAPVITASPTPVETTVKKIPVEPINTSIRTDLPAPTLYSVTGQTATGKTAVWPDASRETASRYLVAGDFVTVVAIVGNESRPYALLDTGEYVLLGSLEAVPVATPTPTAAPTPTKVPVKETTSPVATTAAPTDPPPATTAAPAYSENPDNIKALVIQKLTEKGLWFPDQPSIGDGSMGWTLGSAYADEKYATAFVNGKFTDITNYGASSVSAWIENGYIFISFTSCALPS